MDRRKWFWILLFILTCIAVAALATGWNLVLLHDYQNWLRTVREAAPTLEQKVSSPSVSLWLGIIGFVVALGTTILFFIRLLREMKLNQMQSEFLARISHDLKTPLATLELSSSLLKQGGLNATDQEKLWKSHASELKRLKDQVHLLLESARAQASQIKPHATWINLDGWIEGRIDRWKKIAQSLELAGPHLKCEAYLDSSLMELILDNLIDNAVKFSKPGQKIELLLHTEPQGTDCLWKMEVRDQGLGYDPKESKKIFQRFYRSRHSADYSIPGTGLGLHLVSEAAKKLGLSVGSQSEGHGKGARFWIEGRGRHVG